MNSAARSAVLPGPGVLGKAAHVSRQISAEQLLETGPVQNSPEARTHGDPYVGQVLCDPVVRGLCLLYTSPSPRD